MSTFNRVICPVDLSDAGTQAIELATLVAKQNNATLMFLYVEPVWLPEEAMFGSDYVRKISDDDKASLELLKPTDPSVPCSHQMVVGNAGPEIVVASKTADTIVMSTHGRSALGRILMGSVAHYVLRHAKCPVILVKTTKAPQRKSDPKKDMEIKPTEKSEKPRSFSTDAQATEFITKVMHHVDPIHEFEKIEQVLRVLDRAGETAAPVVDGAGKCIGILTKTDIEKYRSLKRRFEDRDETVIDEMFEVDQYGQRRAENDNFDTVGRHMTRGVISVSNSGAVTDAVELFEQNSDIHHLVVMDEDMHAVGIVDAVNLEKGSRKKAGDAV